MATYKLVCTKLKISSKYWGNSRGRDVEYFGVVDALRLFLVAPLTTCWATSFDKGVFVVAVFSIFKFTSKNRSSLLKFDSVVCVEAKCELLLDSPVFTVAVVT